MLLGIWTGLLTTFAIQSTLDVLLFTKQSSSPETAYRRYKKNGLYCQSWVKYDLKPGTK
jgi:hypothetical protein